MYLCLVLDYDFHMRMYHMFPVLFNPENWSSALYEFAFLKVRDVLPGNIQCDSPNRRSKFPNELFL